jgi:phosphoesterase RecJ-like protein
LTELSSKITSATHIALIAHVHPDADSLGSASAMYSYMLQLQKKVTLCCATPDLTPSLTCIPWHDKVKPELPASADLAICFDCGSKERLGYDLSIDLINIDHHISNLHYGDLNIIDTSAISTTQVVFDLFRELGVNINAKMATALYAGLLDDSHAFTSSKTDARAFEMATALSESGADVASCSTSLIQRASLAALRLKGQMLASLALHHNGTIVSFTVPRSLMESTGARGTDCEGGLEEGLYLPTVEVALMLRENRDGSIKGSLRGKGQLDLSAFASRYGGGGHHHAAGFTVENDTLPRLHDEIIKELSKELK